LPLEILPQKITKKCGSLLSKGMVNYMNGIFLAGTGRYIPEKTVTNDDMSKIVETSDEWIRTRSGISERHFASGETTSYMGAQAAIKAIESAGIAPKDIDMIIVTTITADYLFPSVACLVQEHIGNTTAACFDLNAACTGFAYAVDIAQKYLALGEAENVLIVSTEALSKLINFSDRTTCVLFGDGAGACVLQKSNKMYASYLTSVGGGGKYLYAKIDRQKTPYEQEDAVTGTEREMTQNIGYINMDGKEVYKFAIKAMPSAVEEACKKAGIEPAEIDIIVPHQANIRIVETALKNLNLPMEKAYVNLDKYGNTSSATIPIALDELYRGGRIKKGDKVCLTGFGGGLTYGAVIFEM